MVVHLPYQSSVPHPQPAMQRKATDDIIRQSIQGIQRSNLTAKFIVRKASVNPTASENPTYTSKTQKQITADDTTSLTSDKKHKLSSYYDHHQPDWD